MQWIERPRVQRYLAKLLYGLVYERLHRYPHLSRRIAFRLRDGRRRSFYQLKPWIMATDALLSAARASGPAAKAVGLALAPLTAGASGLAALGWSRLLRRLDRAEKEQAYANLLREMECGRVDCGSARTLRGQIAVGHLYLRRRAARPWSAVRKRRARRRSAAALAWLADRAREHGVALTFTEIDLGEAALPLGHSRSTMAAADLLDRTVWRTARRARLRAVAADGHCVIVHAASDLAVQSWARPARSVVGIAGAALGDRDAVEYAVVFEDHGAAVHAHELLHLFGASDLYGRGSATHAFKGEFMQRAIMYAALGGMKGRVISGTTAQLIGWR